MTDSPLRPIIAGGKILSKGKGWTQWTDSVVLPAGIPRTYTLPDGAAYIYFSCTGEFYAALDSIPVVNGEGALHNPVFRAVGNANYIGFVSKAVDCQLEIQVFGAVSESSPFDPTAFHWDIPNEITSHTPQKSIPSGFDNILAEDSANGFSKIHIPFSSFMSASDHKVLASSTDPTPGFLDDKVDGVTIDVNNNQLTVLFPENIAFTNFANIFFFDQTIKKDSPMLQLSDTSGKEFAIQSSGQDFLILKQIGTTELPAWEVSASLTDIMSAIAKKHTQGTDTTLGVVSADIDMGNFRIRHARDPVTSQDLATKHYVDSVTPGTNVFHTNIPNEINALVSKSISDPADVILIESSTSPTLWTKMKLPVSALSTSDQYAYHKNVAQEIFITPQKTAPSAMDIVLIEDSQGAVYDKKSVTFESISFPGMDSDAYHRSVSGEYILTPHKFTPVGADMIALENSANGGSKAYTLISELPNTDSYEVKASEGDTPGFLDAKTDGSTIGVNTSNQLSLLTSFVNTLVTKTMVQEGGLNYADDLGTQNNFIINLTPPLVSYQKGVVVKFKAANSIAGGVLTINVNSLGVKNFYKLGIIPFLENEILASQLVTAAYDGVNFQCQSNLNDIAVVDTYMVMADASDPSAGYLNTKVDGTTIVVTDHKLVAIGGGTDSFTVKANTTDPTPGFLVDKVDGTTLKVDGTQMSVTDAVALKTDVQDGSIVASLDVGTANNYVVNLDPAPIALTVNMGFRFLAQNACTGVSQITVNGLGPYTILKNVDQPLVANDIKQYQAVDVVFDGINIQMQSQTGNPGNNIGENVGTGARIYRGMDGNALQLKTLIASSDHTHWLSFTEQDETVTLNASIQDAQISFDDVSDTPTYKHFTQSDKDQVTSALTIATTTSAAFTAFVAPFPVPGINCSGKMDDQKIELMAYADGVGTAATDEANTYTDEQITDLNEELTEEINKCVQTVQKVDQDIRNVYPAGKVPEDSFLTVSGMRSDTTTGSDQYMDLAGGADQNTAILFSVKNLVDGTGLVALGSGNINILDAMEQKQGTDCYSIVYKTMESGNTVSCIEDTDHTISFEIYKDGFVDEFADLTYPVRCEINQAADRVGFFIKTMQIPNPSWGYTAPLFLSMWDLVTDQGDNYYSTTYCQASAWSEGTGAPFPLANVLQDGNNNYTVIGNLLTLPDGQGANFTSAAFVCKPSTSPDGLPVYWIRRLRTWATTEMGYIPSIVIKPYQGTSDSEVDLKIPKNIRRINAAPKGSNSPINTFYDVIGDWDVEGDPTFVYKYVGVDNGSGPSIMNIESGTTDYSNDTILISIDTNQIVDIGTQISPIDMGGNAVTDLPLQLPTEGMYNKVNVNRLRELCQKVKRTIH